MKFRIFFTFCLSISVLLCSVESANIKYDRLTLDDQRINNKVLAIERFNHHYPDGSYEFRYELDDGQARYERGYFLSINKVKTLVVVGYYSYRMDDGRYITVFYNADQNGFRQNQSITPEVYPNLPRSIEVPAFGENSKETSIVPSASTTPVRNTPKPVYHRRPSNDNKI